MASIHLCENVIEVTKILSMFHYHISLQWRVPMDDLVIYHMSYDHVIPYIIP